jgi:hypothetical protein
VLFRAGRGNSFAATSPRITDGDVCSSRTTRLSVSHVAVLTMTLSRAPEVRTAVGDPFLDDRSIEAQ